LIQKKRAADYPKFGKKSITITITKKKEKENATAVVCVH
jgi:hypothetical protein